MPDKFLFNISGPYAVGKDTILNELMARFGPRVHRVHTLTTRPVSREADPTYEQVTRDEFERRVSSGRWMFNYQLSGMTAYATSVDEIEEAARAGYVSIHSIYPGPDGAGRLREIFGSRALSIGLLAVAGSAAEQLEVLRARLLARSRDDPAAIEARLQHQLEPIQYVIDNPSVITVDGPMGVFDQVVFNKDIKETVGRVVRLFEQTFFGGSR
jgi:guanylate kinase